MLLAQLSDLYPPPGYATLGLLKTLVLNRCIVFRGSHGFLCVPCRKINYFPEQILWCKPVSLVLLTQIPGQTV